MEITVMGKASESHLRAATKYKQANIVNVALQFNKKTEPELTEYVRGLPNKTAYIKGLIREDVGFGARHFVLCVNDEDDMRSLQLSSITPQDALAEAKRIVELFDGWYKGRIDKSDWFVIEGEVDSTSPTGMSGEDDHEPMYLFRG